jgi:acyl-CoA oxidase
MEDHTTLPGISCGDMGPKMGYGAVDNGYLSFNQYRIPRTNMMMRFSSVSKEGEFELKGDPRILYNIMVQTRIAIV